MRLYRFEYQFLGWSTLVVHVVADEKTSLSEMDRLARAKLTERSSHSPVELTERSGPEATLARVELIEGQVVVDARSFSEEEVVLR